MCICVQNDPRTLARALLTLKARDEEEKEEGSNRDREWPNYTVGCPEFYGIARPVDGKAGNLSFVPFSALHLVSGLIRAVVEKSALPLGDISEISLFQMFRCYYCTLFCFAKKIS